MKAKNEKEKKYSRDMKEKLIEKKEKLKELEKQYDKERHAIMEKLEKMQSKKKESDKVKEEKYKKIKNIREKYYAKTLVNKSLLAKEQEEKRDNILNEEGIKLERAFDKENKNDSMRLSFRVRTISSQKDSEDEMRIYLRLRNNLQNESMIKRTDEQRRKIYLDKLRKEAEERRIKREEKLEKMGLS